jgi:hypothetical protein
MTVRVVVAAEAGLVRDDVLNGVGCGLGDVDLDGGHCGAVDEGSDAEVEVLLRGRRRALLHLTFSGAGIVFSVHSASQEASRSPASRRGFDFHERNARSRARTSCNNVAGST